MAGLSSLGSKSKVHRIIGAAAAVAMAAAAAPALAVVPSPTGFSFDLASSARVLDALDMLRDGEISNAMYQDIKMDEMCDNPHLRIRARNKPALMITNFTNSAAPITSMTLTINEGPYAFGSGDAAGDNFTGFLKETIYTDPGVSITDSQLSADQKTLTVTFDGLTAGKKAIFNIDIDPTDPGTFTYPDYRMALLGAPLSDGDPPTAPATLTATFTGPTDAPNTQTLVKVLPQITEAPDYSNANIRPYHAMDPIDVTGMGVPEPSAGVLAMVGLAALASRRRARRSA